MLHSTAGPFFKVAFAKDIKTDYLECAFISIFSNKINLNDSL